MKKEKSLLYIILIFVWLLSGCSSHSTTDDTVDTVTHIDKSSKEQIPSNWYMRVLVKDDSHNMESFNAQLGELDTSDATVEHTLKALNPFGGSYLDVVFRDPEGVEEGDYKTSFHIYEANTSDSWEFIVRSSDSGADISLSFIGLYVLKPYTDKEGRTKYSEYRSISNPLLPYMKLVDVDSGEEIAVISDGKMQIYNFSMDGKNEKTFKFIVDTKPVNIAKHISIVKTQKVYDSDDETIKKDIKFDLNQPPQIQK